MFRSKLEHKAPITECLVCCVCVLFSMAKYMLKMVVVVFVFVNITFYSFALEFRCCRMIPIANHKLTFDERIGCITRRDDFVPGSHRAVSLQVAPFLKDCKGSVRLSSSSRLNGKQVSLSDSS